MSRVAVLGTGLLGAGFARNLVRKGHDVAVWNRTADKAEALVKDGATAAATPAEAVQGADRVHLVLTADDAVDAVIEAARAGLSEQTWVIDHSTNAPERVAARHPALRAQGVRYVPAPVFMSPANSDSGTGLMLLAATNDEAAELTPILQTMTGKVWHVGERPDQAAVLKLCGNGALVAVAGLMGDLYAIGQANGLEASQVDGLFDVFQIGGIFPRVGERVRHAAQMDTSFALTMARKDVGLMMQAGKGQPLVLLPAMAQAMDEAIAKGDGDRDFAIMSWRGRPGGRG